MTIFSKTRLFHFFVKSFKYVAKFTALVSHIIIFRIFWWSENWYFNGLRRFQKFGSLENLFSLLDFHRYWFIFIQNFCHLDFFNKAVRFIVLLWLTIFNWKQWAENLTNCLVLEIFTFKLFWRTEVIFTTWWVGVIESFLLSDLFNLTEWRLFKKRRDRGRRNRMYLRWEAHYGRVIKFF